MSSAIQRAANLVSRLEVLVRREARAQREHFEAQWAQPLGERVRTGRAMESLRFAGINWSSGRIRLECDRNDSKFREGDYLILHQGDPREEGVIGAVLEYDEGTKLEVSPKTGPISRLEEIPDGWIADEGTFDLSGYFLDALGEVADRETGRSIILPLILGDLQPHVDMAAYERAWMAALDVGLNERQAEATASAYATDLAYLIQGPPGTGKTYVLAHVARMLAEDGARVMVTALTHRAINNALNMIAHVAETDIPICKVGHPSRADDLRVDNCESFSQSGFQRLNGGYIIGATPFATRTSRLAEVEFDTIIFDEASQITLPLAILGMLAGKRYIFIGDDHQLPPVTVMPREISLAHSSIFGYLAHRGYSTVLNRTYRMNDALAAWPSRTFYDGELQPAEGVGSRRLQLGSPQPRWQAVLAPDEPAVFVDLFQTNTTIRSRREADAVVDLILTLLAAGVPATEIGVVTPYRAQGREIRNLLRRALPSPTARRQIVIDTVERMQGQEREVVLVSLATASATFAETLADFYFQPQRLNVTITRSRTKLIIIGSSNVLRAEPADPELAGHVALFREFIETCTTVKAMEPKRLPEA
ncbi:MAG: DNA2/NAM7 family helicase [Anaerolineae bacterium]|nr:DNA2/NAM7 family helicase [Anaerolineae bacterium]